MYPDDPDLLSSSEDEKDEDMPTVNNADKQEEQKNGESDDSNVEDEDNDEVNEEELTELQNKINENPYMYEAHVAYIELLHKAGELDRLRSAREVMSRYFPLTPDMWLQWTSDESSLLVENSDREQLKKLFQRAIADYQDVDIWLEYCQFAIGGMGSGSPDELEGVRQVFEEALSNQGLNFSKGNLLWEIYREFETIVFAQVQGKSTDTTEHLTQLKKIDNIYRRQLNIPHQGIDDTMQEYRAFLAGLGAPLCQVAEGKEVASVPPEVVTAFSRASAKMIACQPFEDQIEAFSTPERLNNSRTTLLDAWNAYLDYAIQSASQKITKAVTAKKLGSDAPAPPFTPLEVICLLERAITANCLEPAVWIKTADFLETHISADVDRLVSILARAVRNTPWNGLIWRRYALASECQAWKQVTSSDPTSTTDSSINGSSTHLPVETPLSRALKQTENIYETAVNCGFHQPVDLIVVWTSYCDFWLRRLLQAAPEDAEIKKQWIIDSLRQTFERAVSHIEAAFGADSDPDCSLLRYWAFVEMKHTGDSGRAQSLWTQMMKISGNGSKPSFWIAYIEFEKSLGNLKHLARVAGMAINSVTGEFSEVVFQTASRALIEAGVDLQRLREFETKLRARRLHLSTVQPQTEENHRGGKKVVKDVRKAETEACSTARPGKRQSENESKPSLPKKRRSNDGQIKEPVEKPKTDSKNPASSQKKHGEYVEHDSSKDDRTVFVSNLPFKITDTDLKDIFIKCGEISSIRLVRDFAGKSKGFGYVEFATSHSVQSALEMDRYPVHTPDGDKFGIGRPMYVSICDPNRGKGIKPFAYSSEGPEPKKLFVRNLGKQVREDALKTFFGQHGTVVNVRLVTFRNGLSRGNAYVEFATEEDASKALVATDGVIFGGEHPIEVAISNPPARSEGGSKHLIPSDFDLSGPTVRSHAHSQLSFMPRALHRGVPSAAASSSASKEEENPKNKASSSVAGGAPKSNDDFRKMFLQ